MNKQDRAKYPVFMKKRFKRQFASLNKVFDFVNIFIQKNSIDKSVSFTLNLAIEELFTNMVKYSRESISDISIDLAKKNSTLIVTLIDFDVEPFDLTKSKEVDIKAHLKDRRVGGLGIHLVKKMVDKIDYEYKNRESKITFIMSLENNIV